MVQNIDTKIHIFALQMQDESPAILLDLNLSQSPDSIMEIEISLKDFRVIESLKEAKVSYRFGSTWKTQVNL